MIDNNIKVTHLAETIESRVGIPLKDLAELKSALIIKADANEPAHFMQCIEERLCSFVQSPTNSKQSLNETTDEASFWYTFMKNQKSIFKKVDQVNETILCNSNPEEEMRSFLKGYDVVFFTLYAGSYQNGWNNPIVTSIINDLINREELAVVFLRGAGASVPMKLGFIKESTQNSGYVEYTDGTHIQLSLKNINLIDNQSLFIFLNKCKDKLTTQTRTIEEKEKKFKNCISLSDSYVCGIDTRSLTNENDWHLLARSITEPKKFSWLIHKTKKVMFTPWYGYSHGNENQCLLTLFALRYLLCEHLKKFDNIHTFKANLLSKTNNGQLSEILFTFND